MKESKLIEMKNQIETLGAALTNVIKELQNVSTLAMGTHKTIKNMPGYQEALDELRKELEKENGQEQGNTE